MERKVSPLLIKKGNSLSEHGKGSDEEKFSSFDNSCVGWFTLDAKGIFKGEDQSFVKYLYLPDDLEHVNMNLAKTHPKDSYNMMSVMDLDENLDATLQWIMENNSDSKGRPKLPSVDFIGIRNMFAKILKLPYVDRDVIEICAIKLNGIIYLCEFNTEAQELDSSMLSTNRFHLNASRQGMKFQHFMLTDTPGIAPDPDEPFIRDQHQLRLMLQASVGNHTLLMSSKVKGIPTPEDLLELPSASLFDVRTNKNREYFRDKLVHWWSDGILGNLSEIFIGLREENGMVRSIDLLKISNMLKQAQSAPSNRGRGGRGRGHRGRGRCTPSPAPRSDETSEITMYNLCFQALNDFLNYVKDTISEDNVTYRFDWSGKNASYIYAKKLSKEQIGEKYQFIPDWYKDWLASCCAAAQDSNKS